MKLLGITEQIVRFLLLKIREGDLKSGERLMSEKEMCEFFGVSRKPVRAAFEYLCQNHVVVSKKGSGYYVCDAADCGEHLLSVKNRTDSAWCCSTTIIFATSSRA